MVQSHLIEVFLQSKACVFSGQFCEFQQTYALPITTITANIRDVSFSQQAPSSAPGTQPCPTLVPQPLTPSATGDGGALFRTHRKSDAVCARLCLVHLSLAHVVSVTEHYSVVCGHQGSYSAHSFDGCCSIKRVALSILLTLFLKEHSFKVSIKCIFFFLSFFYKQHVWCPL